MKRIATILLGVLLSILSLSAQETKSLEVDPAFPGGLEALATYLSDNIQYPQKAIDNNIEGTVYVAFVIEKDGSVSNIKATNDIGGGCSEEAVRVVSSMPRWTPGQVDGQPVRAQFMLPINFECHSHPIRDFFRAHSPIYKWSKRAKANRAIKSLGN